MRKPKKQFLWEKIDIVLLFTSNGAGLAPKTWKKFSSVKNETLVYVRGGGICCPSKGAFWMHFAFGRLKGPSDDLIEWKLDGMELAEKLDLPVFSVFIGQKGVKCSSI